MEYQVKLEEKYRKTFMDLSLSDTIHQVGSETKGPGARFSKVPVTSGPDNLSGPLSGNFIGSDVAFLEAPVNFAGNFRAR